MESYITERAVRQLIKDVSDQYYPMPGTVLAISAAQAAALGEACMQISLDNQVDRLDWQDTTARIEQMVRIKTTLLEWADHDARLLAQYHTVPQNGHRPNSRTILGESPTEIARLSLMGVEVLENFRPLAFKSVQESLAVAIQLLLSTAQTAISLLDDYLHHRAEPELLAEYNAVLTELKQQANQFAPY